MTTAYYSEICNIPLRVKTAGQYGLSQPLLVAALRLKRKERNLVDENYFRKRMDYELCSVRIRKVNEKGAVMECSWGLRDSLELGRPDFDTPEYIVSS